MKTISLVAASAAVAVLLTGCADGPYHSRDRAELGYNAYYDNYYGAIDDGYWGADSYFYYRSGSGRDYRRDDERHVRRNSGHGYVQFHFRDGRHH